MNKDKLTAPAWQTEAAVNYVLDLYHQQRRAHNDWLDKTEWVQETAHYSELGMHRADVMRKRLMEAEGRERRLLEDFESELRRLHELNTEMLEALKAADWYIGQLELIVYHGDDDDIHEERAKVQAAIAKAKGEQV